ncbi:GntR family transcriptional regulator [Escherichia coli]|nr:GntR family transcriptional regulator [Escherichia coli]
MIRIYKASKGQLKHREIFDEIKKKIDNGEWKEGKAIPTERELAEHFLSSRTNNSESNRKFETTRIPA